MSNVHEKIEEIKNNGYELSFENVFEHAVENYKKIAVYAGLMLVVFTALFLIVMFGILISFFDTDSLIKNLKIIGTNPKAVSNEFIMGYFAVSIVLSCLLSPFQAGFLKMADCGEKGEEFHVSTIFGYYKSPYFIRICISTLILTLIGTGISFLIDNAGIEYLGTIITLTVSFLTFLSVPLIIFGELSALDSIKTSIQIVLKKPLVLLGLLLVALILSMVGIIGILIGVFFTIPFLYSINYAIYSAIVGFEFDKI